MPAPDVQYFLDCSVESGHMGADTHFYFMEIASDANAVLDSYEGRGKFETRRSQDFRHHWHGLIDTGLYMESHFIKWRAEHRAGAREASLLGLRRFRHGITEQVRSAAGLLADNGHVGLTPSAMRLLDDRYGFTDTLGIFRRSLNRAAGDLRGASQDDLDGIQRSADARHAENRAAYLRAVGEVRGGVYSGDIDLYGKSTAVELKRAKQALRDRAVQNRRVIKRSVRFLNRLVGQDTTRMFVGGEKIRFEGRLANYEFSKKTTLLNAHGGWHALAVYDKDHPDLRLCNLCIATDKVPLLDHIASLVMHIQTGHEEDILRIGNAAMISPEAYEREWLVPYLPQKPMMPFKVPSFALRDPDQVIEMSNKVMAYVHERVMAPHLDVIRLGQDFNDLQTVRRFDLPDVDYWEPAQAVPWID